VNGLISVNEPAFAYPEPFMFDPEGRTVLLHGVNAVYKRAPYELYVAPGKAWNFDAADARAMARLGFNVVRLGILWQGIEPGTLGPNSPAICTPGTPSDPGQWNTAVADAYLARVAQTVNLLGRYHIYTLLDMHQDVYSQVFRGEGAPAWAVCTDGFPIKALPGRWSNNYANPALNAAFQNFWTNDVVGDLQGEYDRSWAAVATTFANNPWVVGYDPINEPFTTTLASTPTTFIDTQLECFYTGLAKPGIIDGQTADCPPDDPAQGAIARIEAADPHHLVFREPTIFASHGLPNEVGAIDFPNLVLNFHDYCSFRSGVTGNPYDLSACLSQEDRTFFLRTGERSSVVSNPQPHGLPLMMTEFGATQSAPLIEGVTDTANQAVSGWIYWSWKYYDDPTGSAAEALVNNNGTLRPIVKALAQTYPQAVAGSPLLVNFNPRNGAFYFSYTSNGAITAPTLIWMSLRYYYPHGYCATAAGGTITSAPGAQVLQITNPPAGGPIVVRVRAGRCR
jgi:endoglycosylceramidase